MNKATPSLIIGIDFDGTCVTHEFPRIGNDIQAAAVLRELTNRGHRLILFTMRSDRPTVKPTSDPNIWQEAGNYLTDAVNWFKENNIPLWGINQNPEQKSWTDSPKPYCHLYIDDAALGCPLIFPQDSSTRPYVDWASVIKILVKKGIL
jgi:hypothetical protein